MLFSASERAFGQSYYSVPEIVTVAHDRHKSISDFYCVLVLPMLLALSLHDYYSESFFVDFQNFYSVSFVCLLVGNGTPDAQTSI